MDLYEFQIANHVYSDLLAVFLLALSVIAPSSSTPFTASNAKYTSRQFFIEAIFSISEVFVIYMLNCIVLYVVLSMMYLLMLLMSFGQIIRANVLKRFHQAQFFSIMIDETTDISVRSQLCIYGRIFEKGKPVEYFLGLVELENGEADTIVKALLDFLEENDLPLSKFVAFGSGMFVCVYIDNPSLILQCKTHRWCFYNERMEKWSYCSA